jgi:hypothetical protein
MAGKALHPSSIHPAQLIGAANLLQRAGFVIGHDCLSADPACRLPRKPQAGTPALDTVPPKS